MTSRTNARCRSISTRTLFRQLPSKTHLGWIQPTFKPRDAGKVSIIIGTKNHPELIGPCVKSIEELTDYPNYEIVVVDNGNDLPAAQECLAEIARKHRVIKIDNGRKDSALLASTTWRANRFRANTSSSSTMIQGDASRLVELDGRDDAVSKRRCGRRPIVVAGPKAATRGLIFGTMGWGPWHALYDAKADTIWSTAT